MTHIEYRLKAGETSQVIIGGNTLTLTGWGTTSPLGTIITPEQVDGYIAKGYTDTPVFVIQPVNAKVELLKLLPADWHPYVDANGVEGFTALRDNPAYTVMVDTYMAQIPTLYTQIAWDYPPAEPEVETTIKNSLPPMTDELKFVIQTYNAAVQMIAMNNQARLAELKDNSKHSPLALAYIDALEWHAKGDGQEPIAPKDLSGVAYAPVKTSARKGAGRPVKVGTSLSDQIDAWARNNGGWFKPAIVVIEGVKPASTVQKIRELATERTLLSRPTEGGVEYIHKFNIPQYTTEKLIELMADRRVTENEYFLVDGHVIKMVSTPC